MRCKGECFQYYSNKPKRIQWGLFPEIDKRYALNPNPLLCPEIYWNGLLDFKISIPTPLKLKVC